MKTALLLVAAALLIGATSYGQEPEKAVKDTAHATEKAVQKTVQGTEKAADATVSGTKTAAKATADGLSLIHI